MKLFAALLLICLVRASLPLPILRLNGLTLAALGQAQASSLLPQLVLQHPDLLLTPQMVNLNPQLAGPFGPQGPQLLLPNQGGQVTSVLVPNGQQEQLGPQQDPNNPNIPQQAQNPLQGFRYFVPSYGYPQQRNPAMLQPNNGQQNLDRTTQRPQLPLQQGSKPKLPTERTMPAGTQKESSTVPPDPRGDATGPGTDEGNVNFPFLFEP
ncbi:hypothetical protein OJAV_G00006480 [Oryzias javanicus]|uniref:Apin n=1 Tax=Oryzias javanicus TaxID=123683 RepID=A0A3S2PTZ8_ORYJA|nr:hypothetical protein OJAV_G00006480 [Oryzias javanicus]